ncbi:OmpA family protein [Neisseria weaveri]|uniref:Outer membrane protein A n=1 Tax=Neisseria weaveri TaxID=28091 RepID=A0A3S4Z2U6_9NEIS|nr:OmpA family protein [Neisseria weaveri]EGV35818.1 hypothetical protein l13_11560 [Neisseria weaveri ATCC 51223]EGV38574.1 hypothetical protein l11_03760 [Neisseria weaveri LMG 5135]VEJ50190.1 outer membrane protein A [Neisseria weaveri]
MSDNNDHKEQRIGLWLTGGVAALSVLSILFYSIWGWENGKIEGSPNYQVAAASEVIADNEAVTAADTTASETVVVADGITTETEDAAKVIVENGVVKFYFASSKADLAENANDALKDVLSGVQEGKKAVISGFHDKTGNQAFNEELSKQRAFAVRDALIALGVPEAQIELRKPENTEGDGDKAEARRVEVVLE